MHSVFSQCVVHSILHNSHLMHIHTRAVFHTVRVPEKGHITRSTAFELFKLISGNGASVEGLVLCCLSSRTVLTCLGQRGKCRRSWRMTDMLQIFAGMNELSEGAQNAEARATEAERQAQATQQECARRVSERKKGKSAAVPPQQEQEIGAFASKYQPQPFEGEDDKWREWARVFRRWSGRFFGGALAEIYEDVEGHRDDSATILGLALTSLRFLMRDCFATRPQSCVTC